MRHFLQKLVRQFKDLFPSALPQGMTEFDNWANSLIKDYDFPDNDSVKGALATMIMHLGPVVAYKPRRYFVLCVKAGAAKQIAGAVFYDIKQRQKAAEELARKEAAQKAAAEVTSNANEQPQQ